MTNLPPARIVITAVSESYDEHRDSHGYLVTQLVSGLFLDPYYLVGMGMVVVE
jgi:hypothetical protein